MENINRPIVEDLLLSYSDHMALAIRKCRDRPHNRPRYTLGLDSSHKYLLIGKRNVFVICVTTYSQEEHPLTSFYW